MPETTFSWTSFADTISQRARAILIVVTLSTIATLNLFTGVSPGTIADRDGDVGVTLVVQDIKVKPVAARCLSVGC